ncbi:MAG: hypothetical protein JSW33_15800 [bacterium]|nr:MAG: hypothetical protein JSW33_15800 [bacterium]
MKLYVVILLLLVNIFLLSRCSFVGLATGIIIDTRSYEEKAMNSDSLQTLTATDQLKIRLNNSKIRYGKFNRLEILNKAEAGTNSMNNRGDSAAMIIPEKEWKVVINERIGERSYHKNEIRQIEIHKRGYAPVKGFAF